MSKLKKMKLVSLDDENVKKPSQIEPKPEKIDSDLDKNIEKILNNNIESVDKLKFYKSVIRNFENKSKRELKNKELIDIPEDEVVKETLISRTKITPKKRNKIDKIDNQPQLSDIKQLDDQFENRVKWVTYRK